jgi:nucleoside-diphosphate-sugar epimerase
VDDGGGVETRTGIGGGVKTIGIIGASGFVGTRVVEMFHLGAVAEVRPIVRQFKSLARLSRFELDCRIADARDESALAKAFEGCEAVVHAAVGDDRTILGTIEPVWNACVAARVKRLVYLSSGSVHGQNPAPGTDESAALSDRQWNWYNNAKVGAEWKLQELRKRGGVELVILRPMIVFGPRSRWVWETAKAYASGRACLVNGGAGICNSIYVDNLVEAIRLSIEVSGANGEAFLVGDEETVTWQEFYEAIQKHLKAAPAMSIAPAAAPVAKFNLVNAVRDVPGMQRMLPLIPDRAKKAVKGAWGGWTEGAQESAWKAPGESAAALSAEANALQQCAWRLPHAKAARALGYHAPVSFGEGMRRSLAWLDFAQGRGE